MYQNKKWLLLLAVVVLVGVTFVGAVSAEENWDEIVRLAKQEGKLVAYAPTSRLRTAAERFEEIYGIKVETHSLSEVELIERTFREGISGINMVDVVLAEDWAIAKELLVDTGILTNYIPPSAKKYVPEELQNPLLFARINRIIGYNSEVYDGDPIESIWDLTLPEWSGKVIIRDPAITGEHQSFFAEIVRRSDEMAAEYERRFGEPLQLTEANAGLEFLKRLAQNDIILMTSDTRITEAVGQKGQTDPPIGLIYVYSHHRHSAAKNLALDATTEVKPFNGYGFGMYIQMATQARNPNAAKLFIEFLNTPEGYEAWAGDIGFYPANAQSPQPEDGERTWEFWEERLWFADHEYAIENRGAILDAWVRFIQQ